MSYTRPQLHGSFMGYNKSEVNDYMTKLEASVDELEAAKKERDEKVGVSELEIIRLNNVIAEKEDEKKALEGERKEEQKAFEDEKKELERKIAALEVKNSELEGVIERMKKEYQELQKSFDESSLNPKLIQEAILNAQDCGKQIVEKANKEADTIRVMAEMDKNAKEDEGRRLIAKANIEADHVVAEAEKKCEKLQIDYNQMLMDASEFKAELMTLYRRHMELLTAFPEREIMALDVTVSDVPKKVTEK